MLRKTIYKSKMPFRPLNIFNVMLTLRNLWEKVKDKDSSGYIQRFLIGSLEEICVKSVFILEVTKGQDANIRKKAFSPKV